jgi:hypothetical protein
MCLCGTMLCARTNCKAPSLASLSVFDPRYMPVFDAKLDVGLCLAYSSLLLLLLFKRSKDVCNWTVYSDEG